MTKYSDRFTQDRGRERQRAIFINGLARRRPIIPIAPERLEQAAERVLSEEAFAYIAGGAGIEQTMATNRAAFERWHVVPRVLRDASQRTMDITLLGERLPTPLLLAPIGVLAMAHAAADQAVARAAAAEGVPMIFSSQASAPMEQCAAVMGDAPRWFQLYWSTDDEVVVSFVRRAEACGCRAIVLTLDTTLLGWRPRDLELGSLPFLRGMGIAQYTSDRIFRAALERAPAAADATRPPLNVFTIAAVLEQVRHFPGSFWHNVRSGAPRAAVQRFIATYSRPSLTWERLAWLREQTRLPIFLKGVLHPDDAALAVRHGMDGVIVSNHGGRQVDGAIGALDALPGVVAGVGGRIPVLFDSGVRTGADVFKALALGASAVCVGRPYVYGLALAGEVGVREVLRNILAELDLTMGLTGCASIADVARADMVSREGTQMRSMRDASRGPS